MVHRDPKDRQDKRVNQGSAELPASPDNLSTANALRQVGTDSIDNW
jgi:hypothetical protein